MYHNLARVRGARGAHEVSVNCEDPQSPFLTASRRRGTFVWPYPDIRREVVMYRRTFLASSIVLIGGSIVAVAISRCRMRRCGALFASCLFVAAALSAPAAAVPIPWKNCGKPSDLLLITQANASVWPPPVAAPASATATFDTAGNLVNLRLFLVHGISWTFDSGPLPTTASAGFVSLPASFPVSVTSPTLPLAAGPYSTTRTFAGHGTLPVTIIYHANLGTDVDAPVTTTVGLSFNGTPGFPLAPVAGSAYAVQVQMNESGGAEVFCMDLVVPLKTATPFVSVQGTSSIPMLSRASVVLLAGMLSTVGAFAARRRRA